MAKYFCRKKKSMYGVVIYQKHKNATSTAKDAQEYFPSFLTSSFVWREGGTSGKNNRATQGARSFGTIV
jgi:hypothetical protein